MTVHDLQKGRDEERTQILESLGCSLLRFTNDEVLGDIEGVVEDVRNYLENKPPSPLKGEFRGILNNNSSPL